MELHNPFVALLIITGLALVVPFILSQFRSIQLPIVVGEILAGVIIGRSGFDLVATSEILDFLAEFGFAYLMFLSGLEVDFSLITQMPEVGSSPREMVGQPLPMAVLILLATLTLGMLCALGFQTFDMVQSPFLMGLILSTTSLGVVAPVLKEKRLLGSRYGQSLLMAATLADFVTLVLLTIVIAVRSRGLTLDLLLIPVLLLLFVLAARIGQRFARMGWLQQAVQELSHATAQIQVRGAFALMVTWVVLAEAFGVEVILGAFLAGAIANLVGGPTSEPNQEKLDAVGYGFFIPIFFIMVGARLDLSTIITSPSALVLVPALLAASFLVKILPALILRTSFSWRDTLAGGLLLSARLSLIIAASEIALEIGVITQAVESDIVVVAILTTTFAPLLFNRIYRAQEVEERKGLIIVGADQMAELLSRRIKPHIAGPIRVIGDAATRNEDFRDAGFEMISGAGARESALREAGAEQAEALVIMNGDSGDTVHTARLAREVFGIPTVVVGISDVQMIPQLSRLGVRVVQPAIATAMAYEGALRFPTAFDVLIDETDDVEIGETVLYNRAYVGRSLGRLRLPGNALILSIKRDHTVMVPHGATVLQYGDAIAMIGSPESVQAAIDMLS